MRSTPEQPSKTSKTGHFGVFQSKSSDYCLNCEKIRQSDCQEEKKEKIHVLSIPLTNYHILFNMNDYQNLSGKTEQYLSTV